MKNLERKQKCTIPVSTKKVPQHNVQCTTNDERQERKDNGNIDSVSERYRSHGMTDGTERCQTKTLGNDGRGAFTLVELVITIAIVIILSVISVPIYRGYVDKAKWTEGYALLGTIISAQKAYYSEYGNFLSFTNAGGDTDYNSVLGIDARGNKYFTVFSVGGSDNMSKDRFWGYVWKPLEFRETGRSVIYLFYNITRGSELSEVWKDSWIS